MKQKTSLQTIVLTALFAAMIAALTFFVKIPAGTGYIHLGDSMIYLAASFLPTPYALIAGALGGSLADFAGGYTQYIIPTAIIKALISLPFTCKNKDKLLTRRNLIMTIPAGLITIVGYYITDVVLLTLAGNSSLSGFASAFFEPTMWVSAFFTSIPASAIQAVGSVILYSIFAVALDKGKVKSKFNKNFI